MPRPNGSLGEQAPRALGLDGTSEGWCAVIVVAGRVEDAFLEAEAARAVARAAPMAVAVDMPVGLVATGTREADAAARARLPGAASTVFSAPPRPVVEAWRAGQARTHAEASALARHHTGQGISQQAWRLVPKVAEVDALAGAWGDALREVHPEVAFRVLAGERRLARKRSWQGLRERGRLLEEVGVAVPARFAGADRVAPDDVLDAAVCAWVAAGLAAGEGLRPHPERPTQADGARTIAIWSRAPQRAEGSGEAAGAGPVNP